MPAPPPAPERWSEACAELERRVRAGEPTAAEAVLAAFPGMAVDRDRALELIYTEHVLREELGRAPDPAEYAGRFPHLRTEIGRLFHVHRVVPGTRTGFAAATPPPDGAGDGAPDPAPPGYELLGELGRGGMGVVYRAREACLGRDVAVKLLAGHVPACSADALRFREEARITGQLQHPGIPALYELGELPDGRPFLAMKLIQGRTLADLLRDRPGAAADRGHLLAVFEQVCQAVAYAHSRGVIHRDLKPANVMVGAFGEVQVMDWGLAKRLGTAPDGPPGPGGPGGDDPCSAGVATPGPDARTETGSILGTPAYMAPEQAWGEVDRVDARADVFGLGAILCDILTGGPPYTGLFPVELYEKARAAELADARARLDASGADPGLVRLVRACLAADPAERPADAGAVAAAVGAHLAGVQERLRAAELARAAAQAKAAEERKARRLTLALAASVLVTVLLAGLGWRWVEIDRMDRAARKRGQVERALAEAALLADQARRDGDLAKWAAAVAATRQAAGFLDGADGGEADDGTRRQVRRTLADLEREEGLARSRADQAARDRQLLADLEDVRLRLADFGMARGIDYARADTGVYAALFRRNGLDPATLPPEEALTRIRARPPEVVRALVAALDHWAYLEWASFWKAPLQRAPGGARWRP